jgi:hypothetical protein
LHSHLVSGLAICRRTQAFNPQPHSVALSLLLPSAVSSNKSHQNALKKTRDELTNYLARSIVDNDRGVLLELMVGGRWWLSLGARWL